MTRSACWASVVFEEAGMQEQPQKEAGEQRVWRVCQKNNSPDGGQEEQRQN